jgi:hypothetical protein
VATSVPRSRVHVNCVRLRVLTGGTATLKQSESGIEVGVAAARRHAIDTIVRLEHDGPAAGIAAIHPA